MSLGGEESQKGQKRLEKRTKSRHFLPFCPIAFVRSLEKKRVRVGFSNATVFASIFAQRTAQSRQLRHVFVEMTTVLLLWQRRLKSWEWEMYRDALVDEIKRMEEAVRWAQSELDGAPEGKLLIDASEGRRRFYQRTSATEKKGKYIYRQNEVLARRLAQKDYCLKLMDVATRCQVFLERTLAEYDKGTGVGTKAAGHCKGDPLVGVYEELAALRKEMVDPFALGEEEYVRQWLQVEYSTNDCGFYGSGFFSQSGLRVWSKSEVIIADQLDAAQIPYRYEQVLWIDDSGPVCPDFTVLNKRTREEYLWEHFGAMGDHDYCQAALKKLNRYVEAGYIVGQRLLITQESAAVPLDTRVVKAMINAYLR